MKVKRKLYFVVPFLVLVLVFGFGLFTSCKAEEIIEEEIIEEPIEEEIVEEPIEEEIVDLTQNFDGIEIKCTRVIDGDTIEIEDETGTKYKVRYIGIDTPETSEDYEDIATEKNKELVEGKIIRLEKDVSETDKYGRILAYVYVGDIFVNAYLVQEGYAQVSTYPPDVKYADYFLELQQEARDNGKGLWSLEVAEEEQEIQQQEQQQEQTQEQEEQPAQEEEQQEQSYGIEVTSLTSPINRGAQASITIKTAANVLCTITVHYKSGPSKAQGLEPKYSDENGNCTWSWKVGTRTTPGNWRIVITAEGVGQTETYFTVTE